MWRVYKSLLCCGTLRCFCLEFLFRSMSRWESDHSGLRRDDRSFPGSDDRLIDRVTQFLDDERPRRRLEASSRGAIRHNFID